MLQNWKKISLMLKLLEVRLQLLSYLHFLYKGYYCLNFKVPESKLKIFFKSSFYLIVGVAFVTIFSNPMVDALTFLTSTENKVFTDGSKHGQYIPIPGSFIVSLVGGYKLNLFPSHSVLCFLHCYSNMF